MRIDTTGHSIVPLQRVTPPNAMTPTQPVSKIQPVKRERPTDTLSFQAVYEANLPRLTMTDAQRKLERIRDQLIAARTDVPIHFQTPPQSAAQRAANPYARNFLRITPHPADLNASATEQKAAL